MLAAYLVRHLREVLAPLCFTDQTPPERTDAVAPAQRSKHAQAKASHQTHPDGRPIHSFQSLLEHLATLTRNTTTLTQAELTIDIVADPTPTSRPPTTSSAAPSPPTSADVDRNPATRNHKTPVETPRWLVRNGGLANAVKCWSGL